MTDGLHHRQYNKHAFLIWYLPLVCCSSEDTVYPVDDGVLYLLPLELVVYVLPWQSKAQLDSSLH